MNSFINNIFTSVVSGVQTTGKIPESSEKGSGFAALLEGIVSGDHFMMENQEPPVDINEEKSLLSIILQGNSVEFVDNESIETKSNDAVPGLMIIKANGEELSIPVLILKNYDKNTKKNIYGVLIPEDLTGYINSSMQINNAHKSDEMSQTIKLSSLMTTDFPLADNEILFEIKETESKEIDITINAGTVVGSEEIIDGNVADADDIQKIPDDKYGTLLNGFVQILSFMEKPKDYGGSGKFFMQDSKFTITDSENHYFLPVADTTFQPKNPVSQPNIFGADKILRTSEKVYLTVDGKPVVMNFYEQEITDRKYFIIGQSAGKNTSEDNISALFIKESPNSEIFDEINNESKSLFNGLQIYRQSQSGKIKLIETEGKEIPDIEQSFNDKSVLVTSNNEVLYWGNDFITGDEQFLSPSLKSDSSLNFQTHPSATTGNSVQTVISDIETSFKVNTTQTELEAGKTQQTEKKPEIKNSESLDLSLDSLKIKIKSSSEQNAKSPEIKTGLMNRNDEENISPETQVNANIKGAIEDITELETGNISLRATDPESAQALKIENTYFQQKSFGISINDNQMSQNQSANKNSGILIEDKILPQENPANIMTDYKVNGDEVFNVENKQQNTNQFNTSVSEIMIRKPLQNDSPDTDLNPEKFIPVSDEKIKDASFINSKSLPEPNSEKDVIENVLKKSTPEKISEDSNNIKPTENFAPSGSKKIANIMESTIADNKTIRINSSYDTETGPSQIQSGKEPEVVSQPSVPDETVQTEKTSQKIVNIQANSGDKTPIKINKYEDSDNTVTDSSSQDVKHVVTSKKTENRGDYGNQNKGGYKSDLRIFVKDRPVFTASYGLIQNLTKSINDSVDLAGYKMPINESLTKYESLISENVDNQVLSMGIDQKLRTFFSLSETRHGRTIYNLDEKQFIDNIIHQAKMIGSNGHTGMVISLDPPSLGRMKLNITTENSKVTGKIVVESNEVKNLIQNNISQLKDALAQNGLIVESFDVFVGHNGGSDAWADTENFKKEIKTLRNSAAHGTKEIETNKVINKRSLDNRYYGSGKIDYLV